MASNIGRNIGIGCLAASAVGVVGCAGVFGLLIAAGGSSKSPNAPQRAVAGAPATPAPAPLTDVLPVLERLAKVTVTAKEKACDDAAWPDGSTQTQIPVVSMAHLKRMAGLTDPVPQGELPENLGGLNGRTFDGVMEPVSGLVTKPEMEWPMRMMLVPFALRRLLQPDQRIAVIATEKVTPAGYLGWDFSPGFYTGWAAIVDVSSGKPVCQTRFTATSSSSVTKGMFESLSEAVKRDFNDHAATAAHDALYRLSAKSEFDIGLPPERTADAAAPKATNGGS